MKKEAIILCILLVLITSVFVIGAGCQECPVCEETAYCGDNYCQSNEDCSSCEEDCGRCKVHKLKLVNADCEPTYLLEADKCKSTCSGFVVNNGDYIEKDYKILVYPENNISINDARVFQNLPPIPEDDNIEYTFEYEYDCDKRENYINMTHKVIY